MKLYFYLTLLAFGLITTSEAGEAPAEMKGKAITFTFAESKQSISKDDAAHFETLAGDNSCHYIFYFGDNNSFQTAIGLTPGDDFVLYQQTARDTATISVSGDGLDMSWNMKFMGPDLGVATLIAKDANMVWKVENLTFRIRSNAPDKLEGVNIIKDNEKIAPEAKAETDTLIARLKQEKMTDRFQELYRDRVIELLLRIADNQGVNIAADEASGSTCLHYACALGNAEIVHWLIAHGADVQVKNSRGLTPADCINGTLAPLIREMLTEAAK